MQRGGNTPEIARVAERIVACGESRDQFLPAHGNARDVLLYQRHRHVVVLDDTRQSWYLREPTKSAEQLRLRMRASLQTAEELQHQAIVERDHCVGQVVCEETGSSWRRVDACTTRKRSPQRIVAVTLVAVAQGECVPLAIAVRVCDVDEDDRCAVAPFGSDAANVLEPGHSATLAGEPTRTGQRRDVGQRDRLNSLLSLDSHLRVP